MAPKALAQVATAVQQFEGWLHDHFDCESVLREWPLPALDEAGTVVSGTAPFTI